MCVFCKRERKRERGGAKDKKKKGRQKLDRLLEYNRKVCAHAFSKKLVSLDT